MKILKYTNYLNFVKKKRINKKLYEIQSDYLQFGKRKRKRRNMLLIFDQKCYEYMNNKNIFSNSDLYLFEIKLKKLVLKALT